MDERWPAPGGPQPGPDPTSGPTIRLVDGTIYVTHTPQGLDEGSASDRMGQVLAKNMIEGSTRFVFPGGTEVSDANPPASISEDSVVWKLGDAELMGAGSADSLYISAALPSPWSGGRMLVITLAVLLFAGLLLFGLHRAG